MRLDKYPHHTMIGRPDLQIRFDVTFGIDAHFGAPFVARAAGTFAQIHRWLAIAKPLDLQAKALPDGAMVQITTRRFTAQDADWLITMHGRLYGRDDGFDASFQTLVGEIVHEFIANHDPSCEQGWVAERDGERLGSIFCVRLSGTTAKLRLFLITPQARGAGLGKRLLAECMGYARATGYKHMQLWTHESHKTACALYAATGWRLSSSKPVHNYGVDLVEQTWEIDL